MKLYIIEYIWNESGEIYRRYYDNEEQRDHDYELDLLINNDKKALNIGHLYAHIRKRDFKEIKRGTGASPCK